MAESRQYEAEGIMEAAREAIDKPSVTIVKKSSDIVSHWRLITVAAIAMALTVACVAAALADSIFSA